MKSSNKKDFLGLFKPFLITILLVVIVAGVIFGIFGFNKGFDFTGGTQLVVEFPNQTEEGMTEEMEDASSKITSILNEYGIKINSFQLQGKYSEKRFVITFKNTTDDNLYNIRLRINDLYNETQTYADLKIQNKAFMIINDEDYNCYDITNKTSSIDGFVLKDTTIITVSSLIFALAICVVYSLFRLKVSGALTITLSGLLSVILTMAFVSLARIEINTYFFVALGLVELISIYMTVDILFTIKKKSQEPEFSDKNNYELMNIILNENFNKNLMISIFSVVTCFVLGLFGVINILKLSLIVFIGLVVSFVLNLYVLPAFWVGISPKRELIRKTTIENNNDASAEVVEIEEN